MAPFPERRVAHNPAMIPPSGDRRRASRDAQPDPGSVAGKRIAELIDPTVEESYWRSNYMREPYYERGYKFEDYSPGFRTGWEGRRRYENRRFDEVERACPSRGRAAPGAAREKVAGHLSCGGLRRCVPYAPAGNNQALTKSD